MLLITNATNVTEKETIINISPEWRFRSTYNYINLQNDKIYIENMNNNI